MRLIDAGKLLDEIPSVRYPDEYISRNAAIADCAMLICDAPTAYDVDKVAEQIKDVIVNSYDCERLCKRSFPECNNCQEYGYDEEILKQKIIEIIKKGGIE